MVVMQFDLYVEVLISSLWHSWEVVGAFCGRKGYRGREGSRRTYQDFSPYFLAFLLPWVE